MNGLAQIEGLLEKVIIKNDLSGLTPIEKVQHIKNICLSLGLNPLTKPIQLISFKGKEVPYFTKDATEQLRKINGISLLIKETKMIDDLYVVIVEARTQDGRTDSAMGSIWLANLKGEDKANALMKAETKAKRRVTLSICGLGLLDESEADSIPDVKHLDPIDPRSDIKVLERKEAVTTYMDEAIVEMQACKDQVALEKVFKKVYLYYAAKRDKDSLAAIVEVKDKIKASFEIQEFQADLDNAEKAQVQ